jgi:hypothetical protein
MARAAGNPSERDFQTGVLELARLLGWRSYHTHDSRRSAAGFPHLVLVRGERLVFAELKSETGAPSADQRAWLDALAETPAESYLWRPADWPEVAEVLQ